MTSRQFPVKLRIRSVPTTEQPPIFDKALFSLRLTRDFFYASSLASGVSGYVVPVSSIESIEIFAGYSFDANGYLHYDAP